MSKKKKIIIVLLIIASVLCVYKILDLTSYNFVKARAVNYLCDKYDADKNEFELVDYKPSEFYISSSGEWAQQLAFSDYSFEFKYKNKNLFVNRYKGKFYDDYQIDDIEKWCTEWLQQNVDEKIIGISLKSNNIGFYQKNTKTNNKYILSKKDAEDFVINCYSKKYPNCIFYYDEKIDEKDYQEERDYIKNTINKKLNSHMEFQVKIINRQYLTRTVMKPKTENDSWDWYIEYSSWYK
ncbi:MAG: hypothetical protein IJT65_04605 [Eubacterium sp.]|nr:hypothetical protein [Eubacterium sp.]